MTREVEEEVLEKIRPLREERERVWEVYLSIKNALENVLVESGVEAEVTLQGSFAKDTWISGERDLDVFVLFPSSWSIDELKTKGFTLILEAAKRIGRYSVNYAEHPYVVIRVGEVEADVVPAYKLHDPSEARTAVDRTVFHTNYINSVLKPHQRDEVRLLKKFMKAIGVYGAEVRVRGFSGYLCELLVLTYGSFRGVLEEARNWRPQVIVNTLGLTSEELEEKLVILRRKYRNSVMIAPDPVDWRRNAAASVSLKSLSTFSLAAQCYLKSPSLSFFFKERLEASFNELVKAAEGRCLLFIVFNLSKTLPSEVLWGEIHRIRDRLCKLAENFEFKVIHSDAWSDEGSIAVIGIEAAECRLSKYRFSIGPRYTSIERVENFIRKHLDAASGPWISSSGRLLALSERKYGALKDLLESRASEYIVAPDFKVLKPVISEIAELEPIYSSVKGFREWLAEFVLRKHAWMTSCIQ